MFLLIAELTVDVRNETLKIRRNSLKSKFYMYLSQLSLRLFITIFGLREPRENGKNLPTSKIFLRHPNVPLLMMGHLKIKRQSLQKIKIVKRGRIPF